MPDDVLDGDTTIGYKIFLCMYMHKGTFQTNVVFRKQSIRKMYSSSSYCR